MPLLLSIHRVVLVIMLTSLALVTVPLWIVIIIAVLHLITVAPEFVAPMVVVILASTILRLVIFTLLGTIGNTAAEQFFSSKNRSRYTEVF